MRIFAAIDVGSFELTCRIFEYTAKNGMKAIDTLRYQLDLGNDTFTMGKIGKDKLDELCSVLLSFRDAMRSYRVDTYRACGTSAIRETENTMILLDQITQRTGIKIEVLSNSEQRFLNYKAAASKGQEFRKILEKKTAILDIGGGSIQISLFHEDTLTSTQNIGLGVLRLRELLERFAGNREKHERLLTEAIDGELISFQRLYLKNKNVEHMVLIDDYISPRMVRLQKQKMQGMSMTYQQFCENGEYFRNNGRVGREWLPEIYEEGADQVFIASLLIRRCMKLMGAKVLWTPGVTLCDGIGYEYGQKKGLLEVGHDFEQDILACALQISKRYQGSPSQEETLETVCLLIFDSMKKIHGLNKRERLLLRLSAILHDCGKYISIANMAECSYQIVLSTEMIGLSHREREMVANIIRYHQKPFGYYEEVGAAASLDREAYMKIAKLTAILKLGSALDGGQGRKFEDVRVVRKENLLMITVHTNEDMTRERGLFERQADFFEEVYSIRPLLRQKKTVY
ncbi:MAG: HD domain-containing protein [Lachnospiraceae bacterium]|nr:HD domain-containing protein [Lachnospiraceae bacterium]